MSELGVVVALPREATTLRAQQRQAQFCRVAVAGMGAQRAARAAETLLTEGAVALLSWGVAGGLLVTLHTGALVLVEQVRCADGLQATDAAWREQLAHALGRAGIPVVTGRVWSHPHAVTSVHEKQQLAARGCVAVDMESMAVARVACRAGVPFMAIKSICDPAQRALPAGVTRWLRDDGQVRPVAVAMALARRPCMWRTLRDMQRDFNAACASLREAASVLPLAGPT